MTHGFDKDYWESHWRELRQSKPTLAGVRDLAPNPYLAQEVGQLKTGTALDAGCGEGAEAVWLAARGWQVTAVDISGEVLGRATDLAAASGLPTDRLRWVEADLSSWEPEDRFDLVMTHYAHPAMPQLAFYQRISGWVAPGGTLLIVGHLHKPGTDATHQHQHQQPHAHQHEQPHTQHQHAPAPGAAPPEKASATAAGITAVLNPGVWDVVTAVETTRTVAGRELPLHDVVVRAVRR